MNPILLFIVFLLCQTAQAQKIHFTDKGNIWFERGLRGGSEHTPMEGHLFFNGDTVIGSDTYQKLYRYRLTQYSLTWQSKGTGLLAIIKEDTAKGVVYAYIDGKDSVLYDYNRQVGDSFYVPDYLDGWRKVTEIDTININGVEHRVWKYAFEGGGSYRVIEGVGSVGSSENSLLQPFEGKTFEVHMNLTCFKANGVPTAVMAGAPMYIQIAGCALSIDETDNCETSIQVIPNPADKSAYLQLPNGLPNADILIYNIQGQVVYSAKSTGQQRITLGDKLPSTGMYFYSVKHPETGFSATGKFLFNN